MNKQELLKQISELEDELKVLYKEKRTYSREHHLELLKQQEYSLSKDSLYAFLKYSWRTFDSTPFKDSRHIEAIVEHIEACNRGDIKKLVICVPPRSGKTSITSIATPAWLWINKPELKIINASYSHSLAVKQSLASRNIITSPWYKEGKVYWNCDWDLSKDQNRKNDYSNTKNGHRFVASPDSTLIGIGANWFIIDDILNAQDAESKIEREKANQWFSGSTRSRFDDPLNGITIIIMQRLAEGDLVDYVLDLNKVLDPKQQYILLKMPMLFDPSDRCETKIGWKDWRTKKDEILIPDRFPPEVIEERKIESGPYKWASQYQQNPAPIEGGLFKREWFPTYHVLPQWFDSSVIAFDLSMVDTETADETAAVVVGRSGGKYYVIEAVAAKMDVWAQIELIRRLSEKYPLAAKLVEAKANGQAVMDMLKNNIPGIISIQPTEYGGNKEARASAVVPLCYSRSVYLPDVSNAPWLNKLLEQLLWFPKAKRDDALDGLVYSLLYLSLKCKQLKLPVEFESLKTEVTRGDIRQAFNNSDYNTIDVTPTVLRGYFDN